VSAECRRTFDALQGSQPAPGVIQTSR
jgi:hypothetical protein